MKPAPLVSVVIPTFNRDAMLTDALASVAAQTFRDYEVIVVDDGSTDDTRAVVSRSGLDVHYIRQENRGRSAARNVGISAARGALIAFLDSDDLFLPTKLERQVELLERSPEAALCYTGARSIDADTGEDVAHMTWRATLRGRVYREFLFLAPAASPIATPTVLVRASALAEVGGFDESMDMAEDIDLWRRILMRHPIVGVPEPLVVVRLHGGNLRRDPRDIFAAVSGYLERARRDDPGFDRRDWRAGSAALHAHYGRNLTRELLRLHGREPVDFDAWRVGTRSQLRRAVALEPWRALRLGPYLAVLELPERVFGALAHRLRALVRLAKGRPRTSRDQASARTNHSAPPLIG